MFVSSWTDGWAIAGEQSSSSLTLSPVCYRYILCVGLLLTASKALGTEQAPDSPSTAHNDASSFVP